MPASPLHALPLALTALRATLGPLVVALALVQAAGHWFGVCLVLAFLSDWFDGVLARRLGIATPGLRRLDSIADSVFYVCALLAAWRLHAALLRPFGAALALLGALELARYGLDWRKFGKEASYHMWSSKAWGVALFAGFFVLLVQGRAGWPVALAIGLGILADLEGIAISLVLPHWQADVRTLWHALRLRGAAWRG